MPAFQAINLEPEDNVDDQIDTTKELHVDEALKRFQTALKLHAQGPRSRDEANAAYQELFDSEIFNYREATTDYERTERQYLGGPATRALEAFSSGLDVDAGGADGVAANLSLALYLGYKNYGEFFLDKLKDARNSNPEWKRKTRVLYRGDGGQQVLDYWARALDQDPSDPEVWRRAARFAAAMDSGRLKRYCLEAAIELDDDPAIMEVDPPSLAEGLAGEQLKELLRVLGDEIALSHPLVAPWLKKEMPTMIKRHLDPIPFLPDPTRSMTPLASPKDEPKLLEGPEDGATSEAYGDIEIEVPSSWPDLGIKLMKQIENTKAALLTCRSVLEATQPDVEMVEEPEKVAAEAEKENDKDETVTPVPDAKDVSKEKGSSEEVDEARKADAKSQKDRVQSLSTTRKRSQSAAGLPDGAEEEAAAEKRSKRVRRRETANAEEVVDPSTVIANQLQPYQEADHRLFQMTKNILENLGVEDNDTIQRIGELQSTSQAEDRLSKFTSLPAKDLRTALTQFTENTARVLLNKKEQATLGLSSFLEHTKPSSQDTAQSTEFDERKDLRVFAEQVNENGGSMTGVDIAIEWLKTMSQSYVGEKWSDNMKLVVVQMLNRLDSDLYHHIRAELERCADSQEQLAELDTLIPMLFELHVDIYERITNPSSVVDYATRVETKDRLSRWLNIASSYVQLLDRPICDPLCARYLWASVMASSLADEPTREHILLMWTSLRDYLTEEKVEPMLLPNNVVMPNVSSEAADREISKLTTMDFFLGLFQEEMDDPLHVIETLEPVLNPSSVVVARSTDRSQSEQEEDNDAEQIDEGKPISECATQNLRDLWKFLLGSSTELRLFLWSRLGDAYGAIDYKTKKFSCYLKSIEMIVNDLEGDNYAKIPDESRRLLLMRTMKSLDELLIQSLTMSLNDPNAFEIIDEEHLKASTATLAKVSCLLHVAALCEDDIRVGITSAPSRSSTFNSFLGKLREMQVRAWCLQYTLFKHAIPQNESFISPDNERADYLNAVHQVIGLRKFCKVSNKIFLKMMRAEILKLKALDNWEDYLEQVLYDLYGLKLGTSEGGVQEHDCPWEQLERRQTMQLVKRVVALADRMPIKDLLKSDLKTTIDHMQQTIGQLRSTPQMIHNLRNFGEYLKKPIHPLRLYRALSGDIAVDAVTINIPESALAKHGWYFLLGMIALTKFKGVDLNRRQTPGATDDLRIGATFLRQQLQFTADKWDAWFRLAECFDYELDEAVLWSADKMNKDRSELVKFQRQAIHCYTLALSHSHEVDLTAYEGDPLHDLYHKFGMRLYASSREPFAMEPFRHSDQERFCIEAVGIGTFKRILHDEMPKYKVWKFAAKLFRMAIVRKPANWKNYYMLTKCYWKMYQAPDEDLDIKDKRIKMEGLLSTLKKAAEAAHNARKSRSSEPILEPHYKIVSILHKLVLRGDIMAKDAASILSEQPLGTPVNPDDHFAAFSEPEDWEEYVIRNLTKLRDKDKSNWQHRIIIRHATILFNENEPDKNDLYVGAKAAFSILRESMFTKTMVMNVWKCDAERPGRHHVYTEQYTRFTTNLLTIISDRFNMEQLLRRLRKKAAEFYHFPDLWHTCLLAYVKLLRKTYKVDYSNDEVFKAMTTEEFEMVGEKVTEWSASDGPHIPAFDCMKDAIEVKKLNASLTRAGPIDDVINDCYILIYFEVARSHPELEVAKMIQVRREAKEAAAESEAAAAADAEGSAVAHGNDVPETDALGTDALDTDALGTDAPNTDVESKTADGTGLLKPTEGQDSRRETPTPQESEKQEAGPRARRIGIRRPDVIRKAEQAVARSMEPKPKSRVGSVSSGKRGSQTPAARMSVEGSDEDEEDGPDAQVRREAEEGLDAEMKDVDGDEQDEHDEHGEQDEQDEHEEHEEADEPVEEDEADGEGEVEGEVEGEIEGEVEGDMEDEVEGEAEGEAEGEDEGEAEGGVEGGVEAEVEDEDEEEGEGEGEVEGFRGLDDSDDESDLSDLPDDYDEEMPPGLLFSNLTRADHGETSGEEADSESEGDEPGEDEAEEVDDEAEDEMAEEDDEDEEMADEPLGEVEVKVD